MWNAKRGKYRGCEMVAKPGCFAVSRISHLVPEQRRACAEEWREV